MCKVLHRSCLSASMTRPSPSSCLEVRVDAGRDLRSGLFEREVAAVEQVDLAILQVVRVGLRAGDRKERITFAPGHQRPGLVRAEVGLPGAIAADVALVV